jgi:hypothetical protein
MTLKTVLSRAGTRAPVGSLRLLRFAALKWRFAKSS